MQVDSDPPDPNRCNATTRDGSPCRKWPVGGAGEGRCRLHGGASTGPADTSCLEGNDHAEGNPGGGAPEGNANAEIHGGFSDWRLAYERLDDDARAHVDRLAASRRETAAEHAPDVPADERERLCREMATLTVLKQRASTDVWCDLDGSGPGRGLLVETDVEHDGETATVERLNPALRAASSHFQRRREISEKLRLWPGFQTDD